MPAIPTVPVRERVVVLAATSSVTVPLAVPPAGVTVIHGTFDTAVQLQPAIDVTAAATEPPVYATDALSGETV